MPVAANPHCKLTALRPSQVCSYEWIGSSQVQGAVPFGVQELQAAVVKAGEWPHLSF